MYNKLVSRFALTALLALPIGLSQYAQADVTAPVSVGPAIAFSLPDEITIHKTQFCVPVQIKLADPAGVTSATLVGGSAAATGQFPSAPQTATCAITFYSCYFRVGNYSFKATATNTKGVQTTHSVMIHLVP